MEEMNLLTTASGSITTEGAYIDSQRFELVDSFFQNSEYLKSLYNKNMLEHFEQLKQQWLDATQFSSLKAHQHPAYQEIIALGHFVIPILLSDLAREKNHWFVALKSLTNINAVKPEHAGKIDDMVNDWVQWGKTVGFID